MHLFNSYRIQFLLLLATIIVGIYTLISISNSSESVGSVITQDGLIINTADNKPYTGRVIDTVANQIISFDVKDGMKNGDFIISFLDGKKVVSGKILNNKNDGKWSYYYSTGKLESEGYFNNDVVVGNWVWYYPNGNKMEEGKYIDGERDGLWQLYNEDGTLKSSVFFHNGNMVRSFDNKSPVAS